MKNNENNKTGIVLNRMYTGSYLSTNLGHEVINMFQADNGKHYLYLNAKGNFDKDRDISDMLLVRYVGENKVEILAWASQLTPAPGANMSYTKFDVNSDIFQKQQNIINKEKNKSILSEYDKEFNNWSEEKEANHEITYGGVNLMDIFGEDDQQNIYITYRAGQFYLPQKPIYIRYVNEDSLLYDENKGEEESSDTLQLSGYQFGKTTLKQYIYPILNDNNLGKYKFDKRKKESKKFQEEFDKEKENDKSIEENKFINLLETKVNKKRIRDWDILMKLLKDNTKWIEVLPKKKVVTNELLNSHKVKEVSLFDIMPQLQRNENCFSDALMYFIKRDKKEWQEIFEQLCNNNNIGVICSIEREKDATIGKNKEDDQQTKKKKGGRIDLLIRTENAYIVIENKIKSDINSKEDDEDGKNQLDRYRKYVTYRIIGDSISQLSDENAKKDYDENIVEKLNNYNINEEGKAYFFILAPDYNMPETYELKGYSPLYYSTLVGIVKDKKDEQVVALMKKYHKNHENENLWSAFYNAMKRHSYKDESLSLYEDMKNTFFTRIKELREKSND